MLLVRGQAIRYAARGPSAGDKTLVLLNHLQLESSLYCGNGKLVDVEKKNKRITNLQALRAFAALNVVVFHCIGTSQFYGFTPQFFLLFEGWGANGVDIFFVISGFVMIYTQWRSPRHPYNFALNRLLRIAPIYWVLTTFVVVLFLALPEGMLNSSGPDLSSILFSYIFLAGALTHGTPVIYVGWTLEYEMAFYAIFAGSAFIKDKILQLGFLGLAIAGLIIFLPYDAIALEFLFGVIIGALYLQDRKVRHPWVLGVVGIILLSLSLGHSISSIWRPIIWGVPAALIVTAALFIPQARARTLTLLGDASYSIYLVQIFTIPAAYKLFDLANLNFNGDFLLIVVLLISALGGLITYYLLERPITSWIRRRNWEFRRSPLYPIKS